MNTNVLFYKMFNHCVTTEDYVSWAVAMLENDKKSMSLFILSSLNNTNNIFEAEDYFYRTLKELDIQRPFYEEAALDYIRNLAQKIVTGDLNAIETGEAIFTIVCELGYPDKLEVWLDISDKIDEFKYKEKNSPLEKAILTLHIVAEAKRTIIK